MIYLLGKDLVSKVEIGRCLGHTNHEVVKIKISVGRKKSASNTSTLDVREAGFRLLRKVWSKVPGKMFLQCCSLFKCYLLGAQQQEMPKYQKSNR